MSSGTLSGLMTAVLILLFIGITIWAYSAKRRHKFDAAARMPLEEDPPVRTDSTPRKKETP